MTNWFDADRRCLVLADPGEQLSLESTSGWTAIHASATCTMLASLTVGPANRRAGGGRAKRNFRVDAKRSLPVDAVSSGTRSSRCCIDLTPAVRRADG